MKCSLGMSNFLEEISSLSHSVAFLYFFALITEEGFLIKGLCGWQEQGVTFPSLGSFRRVLNKTGQALTAPWRGLSWPPCQRFCWGWLRERSQQLACSGPGQQSSDPGRSEGHAQAQTATGRWSWRTLRPRGPAEPRSESLTSDPYQPNPVCSEQRPVPGRGADTSGKGEPRPGLAAPWDLDPSPTFGQALGPGE